MPRDILVGILEDDVFARSWMALLTVRDWRTRLVGEFINQIEFFEFLRVDNTFLDILVMDVDLFDEDYSVLEICDAVSEQANNVKILLTGVSADTHVIQQLDNECLCGYVLKHEVGFSLSWAISFAYGKQYVLTPGIMAVANQINHILPENKIIIDGRKKIPGFTDHEAEVARLAFVFSLGRRDLADELSISTQWSYGLVSELYKKMGLNEILSGEEDLFSYIGESRIIKSHFSEIMAQLGTSKKAQDMEILAYHLMTMPEIII